MRGLVNQQMPCATCKYEYRCLSEQLACNAWRLWGRGQQWQAHQCVPDYASSCVLRGVQAPSLSRGDLDRIYREERTL